MKSCLIILYSSNSSDIYKSLNLLKYKKILNINSEDFQSEYYKDSNVEIISSYKSGVGKSTQIEQKIEEDGKTYVHFPFGGVLNRKEVVDRLKKLKKEQLKDLENPKKYALHLDLYDTDQTELMTEFLFSILITKLYGQNEDLFYFSKEMEIKVEIPNGFVNFVGKFPILSLFSNTTYIKELPPLIVPKNIDSNIQIVANYLKALQDKQINDKDLYFENITLNEYDTKVNAEILPQKKCQDLIFEAIKETITSKNEKSKEENDKNQQPNYYQIKSFIEILACQFKKFNNNAYINANILIEQGNDTSIRTEIIENFINLTKYFTKGAFTEIIESQEITHSFILGKYKEEKDANEGLNKLSNTKHDVISFDKINPSLLFFHEDGQKFSIITNLPKTVKVIDKDNCNNNSEKKYKEIMNTEYEKLYKLKNSQAELLNQEEEDLPNYKTYKPKQFLEEIRDILNLVTHKIEKDNSNNKYEENLKDNIKDSIDFEEEEEEEEEEEREEEEEDDDEKEEQKENLKKKKLKTYMRIQKN